MEEMEWYAEEFAAMSQVELVFLAGYLYKRLEKEMGKDRASAILERAMQRTRRRKEFDV